MILTFTSIMMACDWLFSLIEELFVISLSKLWYYFDLKCIYNVIVKLCLR